MTLGTVVGAVWGSCKAEGLTGERLLLIALGDAPSPKLRVAVDRLGAGPGDRVLIAHGTRVRDLTLGERVPEKDVVVAILDGVDDRSGGGRP